MKKLSLFFYILFASCLINAQNPQNEIPFRLTTYNNIIIPVVLNKTDTVQLMFHTGSDYISIIENSIPKVKSLIFNDTIRDVTSWAGHSDQLMSKNNQLSLGKYNFNRIPIFIDQQSGHESDGKIGLKFFENKYLEINFEQNKLLVYDYIPKHLNSFQNLEAHYEQQTLFFSAEPLIANRTIPTEFMFHTGYSGAIIFSDEYVKNNHLLEKIKPNGQTQFSDAAGNIILSKTAVLELLKIKNHSLMNLPISYFDSQVKIQHINIFGGDLIKRFNWIFSPDLQTIYLKPNSNFNEPYFKLK